MSDASITLQCECNWLSCQARVSLFEEDGTGALEIILPRRSFWERLRLSDHLGVWSGASWVGWADEEEEEETDWENYETGPFCRHWGDPSDCDIRCANCGHTCAGHDDVGCEWKEPE